MVKQSMLILGIKSERAVDIRILSNINPSYHHCLKKNSNIPADISHHFCVTETKHFMSDDFFI